MAEPESNDIAEFRRTNGFARHDEASRVWIATFGPLELPLPNFRWRREVLAQHDAHHLLTGFDTSAKGELLVASWEVGARVYCDWRARTFCRFLMALGIVRYPRETWRAFLLGRSKRSYALTISLD